MYCNIFNEILATIFSIFLNQYIYVNFLDSTYTRYVDRGPVMEDPVCRWYLHTFTFVLARAVGVAVVRRSGCRLATTLVATKNVFIFFSFFPPVFFSPSSPFLIEGVLGSKNLFSESGSKWPIT